MNDSHCRRNRVLSFDFPMNMSCLFSYRPSRSDPFRMISRAVFAILLLIPAAHAQMTPGPVADGRSRYAPLLTAEAIRRGIPPALADAVATVESAYDTGARGSSGEIGLMQVLPSTADMLGFRGDLAQLADPTTNIQLG